MNSYLEGRMKHVTNVVAANLLSLSPDFRYIVVCKFGLPGCLVLSDAQSQAWISLDDATIDGLLHEDAQDMDFIERRIMDCRPASVRWPLRSSPSDVVEAVLATEGLGAAHLPLVQEQGEGLPAVEVESCGAGAVPISQSNPLRDPRPARSLSAATDATSQFVGGSLSFKGTGLPHLQGHIKAEPRGHIAPFALRVDEADPVVFAPNIEIRHTNAALCNICLASVAQVRQTSPDAV